MHVMGYTSSDREVIRFLFSVDEWVDLYALHEDFRLSPAQILDIIERMVKAGLAEVSGTFAKLTLSGRNWVIDARGQIFFGTNRETWRTDGREINEPRLGLGAPYLPDLSLIDRAFFIKLALDGMKNDGKL